MWMLTSKMLLISIRTAAVLKAYFALTKLLQKSEMRKVIVIELSYKGFS